MSVTLDHEGVDKLKRVLKEHFDKVNKEKF
jgi:hypothetical protein